MDRPCADPARVAEKCNDMLPAFCCILSLESLEVALWCASRNGICLDFQSQCWMWICGDLVEHQSHSTRGSRRKICDGHGWGRQICQHAKHIKALNGQFVLMFLFVHITHHNLLVSSRPPRNGSTIRGLVGFGWLGTSVWQVVSGPSMQTSVLGQNIQQPCMGECRAGSANFLQTKQTGPVHQAPLCIYLGDNARAFLKEAGVPAWSFRLQEYSQVAFQLPGSAGNPLLQEQPL